MDEVCVLPRGHALASRAVLTPEDFADQAFVSLAPTDPYRQQIDAVFERRRGAAGICTSSRPARCRCVRWCARAWVWPSSIR